MAPSLIQSEWQSNSSDFKLRSYKPQQGISAFELLRLEWIATHSNHSEIELLIACKQFAKLSGLVVREQIYINTINTLNGNSND